MSFGHRNDRHYYVIVVPIVAVEEYHRTRVLCYDGLLSILSKTKKKSVRNYYKIVQRKARYRMRQHLSPYQFYSCCFTEAFKYNKIHIILRKSSSYASLKGKGRCAYLFDIECRTRGRRTCTSNGSSTLDTQSVFR